MAVADRVPDDLAGLATWLAGEGFVCTREQASDAFGDKLILYERGPCGVRFVHDRAQWFLEIAGPYHSDWFDADVWRSCLENRDPPTDLTPLAEQAAYLRGSLACIEEALRSDCCLADRLHQRRRWRAQAWGLTPPRQSDVHENS